MDEQTLLYWLCWLTMIIFYFFPKKPVKWLLLGNCFVILLTNKYMLLFNQIPLHLASLVLFVGLSLYVIKLGIRGKQFILIILLSFLYLALMLWEIVAPIWFVLHSYLLVPLIIMLITYSFYRKLSQLYLVGLLSIVLGQFMFELLLYSYALYDEFGQLNYMISFYFYLIASLLLTSLIKTKDFLLAKFS